MAQEKVVEKTTGGMVGPAIYFALIPEDAERNMGFIRQWHYSAHPTTCTQLPSQRAAGWPGRPLERARRATPAALAPSAGAPGVQAPAAA